MGGHLVGVAWVDVYNVGTNTYVILCVLYCTVQCKGTYNDSTEHITLYTVCAVHRRIGQTNLQKR